MMTPTVWRCSGCGAKLARMLLLPGSAVEVKCGHCNQFTWMPNRAAWEAATIGVGFTLRASVAP